MNRSVRAAGLVTATVLVASGCSPSDGGPSAPATTTTAVTAAAPAARPSSGVRSGPPRSIPVIAEQEDLQTTSTTGKQIPGDTVTIGIRSLTVDPNGKTMTLRLVITPKIGSEPATASVSLYDLFVGGTGLFGPFLLDRTNLKRYDVLRTAGYQPMVSELATGAPNGTPFEAWAVFAAPQDQVDTLDVSVKDLWPPFANVPVTPANQR